MEFVDFVTMRGIILKTSQMWVRGNIHNRHVYKAFAAALHRLFARRYSIDTKWTWILGWLVSPDRKHLTHVLACMQTHTHTFSAWTQANTPETTSHMCIHTHTNTLSALHYFFYYYIYHIFLAPSLLQNCIVCQCACVCAHAHACGCVWVCQDCVCACDSLHCENDIVTLTFIHG